MTTLSYEPGADIDDRLARALPRLPIFPLPSLVLLPGSIVPLHVFEPRYLAMTKDVLATHGMFGVAQLLPNSVVPYEGRPPVLPYVGVAEILAAELREDGRYDLAVRGLVRARIDEELPETRSYRHVRAHHLVDVLGDNAQVDASRRTLLSLVTAMAPRLGEAGPRLTQVLEATHDPGRLADYAASALVRDPSVRLLLLAEPDVERRLERVAGELASLMQQLGVSPTEVFS